MRRRLPSVSILTCFEASARHESFTLAAEELGITQSSANRMVRELERQIGVPLLRRSGRAVRLTAAGARLAADLRRDLDGLGATIERAIVAGTRNDHITIGSPPTFAAHWLIPKIARYLAGAPGLALSMRSFVEPFDLRAERVDLAIHYGTADWPGVRSEPLCGEEVVAVVSTALAESAGIAGPADLHLVPRLLLSSRPEQWDAFDAAHGLPKLSARGGMAFDQFSLLIAAALNGLGVGLIPSHFIEREIGTRALRVLGHAPARAGAQYFLLTPDGPVPAPVARFSTWLRRESARTIGDIGSADRR